MKDTGKLPVDELSGAIAPLRQGADQVEALAELTVTPDAKSKIQDVANDLTAMADAYQGQASAVRAGGSIDTKAADMSSKQLTTDAGDLASICWS